MKKLKNLKERICALIAVVALLLTTVIPAVPVYAGDDPGTVPTAAVTFSVTAKDASGNPLEGVSVAAEENGAAIETQTTKGDGMAIFTTLEEKEYSFRYSKDGYQEKQENVNVISEGSIEISLSYRQEAIKLQDGTDAGSWKIGDSATFEVTTASSNNTLNYTWTSSKEGVLSITSTSSTTATFEAVGTDETTVSVTNSLGQKSNEISVNVVKRPLSVELGVTPESQEIYGGETYTKEARLTATVSELVKTDTTVVFYEGSTQIGDAQTISAGSDSVSVIYPSSNADNSVISGAKTFKAVVQGNNYYDSCESAENMITYTNKMSLGTIDKPSLVSGDFEITINPWDTSRDYTYTCTSNDTEGIISIGNAEKKDGNIVFPITIDKEKYTGTEDKEIKFSITREAGFGFEEYTAKDITVTLIPQMVLEEEAYENEIEYTTSERSLKDLFPVPEEFQRNDVAFKYSSDSDKIEITNEDTGAFITKDITDADEPVEITIQRVEKDNPEKIIDTVICSLTINKRTLTLEELKAVNVSINPENNSKIYDGNPNISTGAFVTEQLPQDLVKDSIGVEITAQTESKDVLADESDSPRAQEVTISDIKLTGDEEVIDRYTLSEEVKDQWIASINDMDPGLAFTINPKVLSVVVNSQEVTYGDDTYETVTAVTDYVNNKYTITGIVSGESFEDVFTSVPQIVIPEAYRDGTWVKQGTNNGILTIETNKFANYNYTFEEESITKGDLTVGKEKIEDILKYVTFESSSNNCYLDEESGDIWAKTDKPEDIASQDGESFTEGNNFDGAELVLSAIDTAGYNRIYYNGNEITNTAPLKIDRELYGEQSYQFVLKRIDGNGNEIASTEAELTVKLDNASPEITSSLVGESQVVNKWIDIITFGFGSYASDHQTIKANITFKDPSDAFDSESVGSGIASVECKSVKITEESFDEAEIKEIAFTQDGYETITNIEAGSAEVTVGTGTESDIEEGNYILFVRATDNVGNGCIFVSTGAIYDYTAPSVKIVRDDEPISVNGSLPIYDDNIAVTVYTNDFVQTADVYDEYSDTASGVKSIEVTITSTDEDGNVNESTESYETLLGDTPTLQDLLEENEKLSQTGFKFSIDKAVHNSNDIKIKVIVTDRAGKVVTKESEYMAIDTTPPAVSYTYDNNDVKNGVYYKDNRTASITVTERNMVNDLDHLYIAVKEKNQQDYSRYSYDDLENGYLPGVSVSNYMDGESGRAVTAYTDNRAITFDLTFSGDNEYDWYCYVEDTNGKSAQTEPDFFILDKTAPVLKDGGVKYYVEGTDVTEQVERGEMFSSKQIKAVVTIDETNFADTNSGFADGQMNVTLTASDYEGNGVDVTQSFIDILNKAESWSNWDERNGLTREVDMTFTEDANYQFGFTYTDLAGNSVTYTTRTFTHDHTNPTGSVAYDTNAGHEIWRTFFNLITFGRFSIDAVPVTFTGEDVTAGVASMEYYKAYAPMTYDEVTRITDWTPGTGFTVEPNEQFVPYLKVTDRAGNVEYFSSEFAVVADNTRPEITITEVNQSASRNGIYNEDVNLRIDVTDPTSGNTYSGLERIWYDVTASGNVSQSETITLMDNSDNRVQSHQGWSGNVTIPAQRYNSNDVRVQVHAVDFSGNQYDSEVLPLKIDVTEPTIQVTYDLNSPLNDRYYNATRTATVVVTDRNFDESAVRFDITNTDGTQPSISGWSHSSNSGVSDEATHTCSVTFSADGDYTFTLNVTDLAGNDSHYTQVDDFTIDQTDPTIQVSYDNNNDAESGYYNEDRTATITVTEHNFNESEVNAQITARLQGSGVSAPGVGGWSTRGDVHTASVTFSSDADYTFDIDYTDLAGNAAADYTEDSFTIDQTAPEVEFFDIEDKSANKDTVAPGVRYSDVNYTSGGVDITIEGAIHPAEDVDGTRSNIANGESIKMADFAHTEDNDDVYTMTAVITDRAGNETEESIVFSVNRFGSTYEFSPETKAFLEDHDPEDDYTYTNDPQDIVVTERNVDTLVFNGISYGRDGTQTDLEEGSDYTVRESGSEVSWKEYMYNISRNNFEEEGHYILNIDSEDRAENSMNNKVKGLDIEFTVDKTVPTLVITGVEEDSYRADTRDMTVNVADNTAVKEVQVLVDGEVAQTYDRSQIEQMGGELTYTIQNANSPRVISAVAVDLAGNETTYSLDHEVLVTSNLLIQYVNNTPLVVGSIIAVIVIAGAAYYFLIIAKRRKKGQEK